MHTEFWWEYLRKKDHLEDLENNIKMALQELGYEYGLD